MVIKKLFVVLTFLLISLTLPASAQEGGPEDFDEDAPKHSQKGFHAGLYLGAYWPNDQPSTLYDGYGFDFEENKNTFANSWMYQKIIVQYGGYGNNGQPDYIAEALGVEHDQWSFDESDMPFNMSYKTAFAVGFSGRYSVDEENVIIFNVHGSILKATGNFTIQTVPAAGSTQVNESLRTCNISGEEQRLLFQLGYQRIFGKGDGMHLFFEGGLHATLAQFVNNEIQIENLVIDIVQDYYDPTTGYTFFVGNKPVGLGFGAFGGVGLHFETNSRWNLQLLYSPLLDNVRIGYDQKLAFGQMVGMRAYFKTGK